MANLSTNISQFIKNLNPFSVRGTGSPLGHINTDRHRELYFTEYTTLEEQDYDNLQAARNACHKLYHRGGVARAVSRVFIEGVIGQGIKLNSTVHSLKKVKGIYPLNEEVNKKIVDDWEDWGRAVTTNGKLSLHRLTQKILHSIIESGEVYILQSNRPPRNLNGRCRPKPPGKQIQYSLSVIEPDMIDEKYDWGTLNQATGERWIDGIKYDRDDVPVSYAIKVYSTKDHYETYEYDANNIIALRMEDLSRPNSLHSWPWLTSVVKTISNMDAYYTSQLVHAKNNAAVTTWMIKEGGGKGGGFADEYGGTTSTPSVHVKNNFGSVRDAPPNTKSIHERPQVAATQITPFLTAGWQEVAAAVGVSYETLKLEYSNANFASTIRGNLKDTERFRNIRQFLIEEFLEVIYLQWLKYYLLTNPFEKIRKKPNLVSAFDYAHNWSPKEPTQIDPAKAAMAAQRAMDMGIVSRTTVAKMMGHNLLEQWDEVLAETVQADKRGIKLQPLGQIPVNSPVSAESVISPQETKGNKQEQPQLDDE